MSGSGGMCPRRKRIVTIELKAGFWDALLSRRIAPYTDSSVEARVGTKLAGLLLELAQHGPSTTLALSQHTGLTSRQVWGLLKAPRALGQVRYAAGSWEPVVDFAGRDVERAASLLREHGWRVEPPRTRG